ncbi:MAG: hypothetical protein AAFW89_02740 [Bacteroidota bacterium]
MLTKPRGFFPLGVLRVIVLALVFVPAAQCFGQPSEILSVEVSVDEVVSQAQALGLTSLDIDDEGQGATLFRAFLRNLTDKEQTRLFFEVTISSGSRGLLATIESKGNTFFSMQLFQVVTFTINDLQDG